MSIPVNLKILKYFGTTVDEYNSDFCSYLLVAHRLLTSIKIFYQSKRKVLKEMTFILLGLHKANQNLVSVL